VLQDEIRIGDQIVIWRAGKLAGAIAIGRITELPTENRNVKFPDALGNDLWRLEVDEPSVIKAGVSINDVRLSIEDGMVSRKVLKDHPILQNNRIITNPQGTVFRLSTEEFNQFRIIWDSPHLDMTISGNQSAIEGTIRLRQHYFRERSQYLVTQKREEYISKYGHLRCEICGLSEGDNYPNHLGVPFIEVHHRVPLSTALNEVKTTMDDLVLLCANCHRTVHSSKDVERNFDIICDYYGVNI
jgi:hypothetical protein